MEKVCTKLIFLDFDGVITTYRSGWNIDKSQCEMIKELCDNTGAKIVITSSWRYENLKNTIKKNRLENWILKDYCIGITKRCNLNGDSDYASWFIPRRGLEIEEFIDRYIRENNITDDVDYVILDDDVFEFLYNQHPYVVQTNWEKGVSKKDIKRAEKILSKK